MQRHLVEFFFLMISFISTRNFRVQRRKHISYTIVSFVSHAHCLTMMLMVAPLKSIIDNRHVVHLGPFHSIKRREHFIHKVHYKTTFGDHLSAQKIVINWIFPSIETTWSSQKWAIHFPKRFWTVCVLHSKKNCTSIVICTCSSSSLLYGHNIYGSVPWAICFYSMHFVFVDWFALKLKCSKWCQ